MSEIKPQANYERVIIQGLTCLKGRPEINQAPFKDLLPGDKVIQVGGGKRTGGNRIDEFSHAVIYAGYCSLDYHRYIAFRIPAEGVTGWGLFNQEQPVYVVYEVFSDDQLSMPDFKNQTLRMFMDVFTKED